MATSDAAGANGMDPVCDSETVSAARTSLGRLLALPEPVGLDTAGGGDPRWLRSGEWRLFAGVRAGAPPDGETIATFRGDSDERFAAVQRPDGTVWLPFDPDEAYRNYVTEAWSQTASQHKLSESQLAVYYRVKKLLPRAFWLSLRRAFIRMGRTPEFPAWPLDTSVERLLRFYAQCLLRRTGADEASFSWFWPGTHTAAVILTHDVESAEGLRLSVEIADLEEERGLRSSFNVVGGHYPIDYGIVEELRRRGFEIGLHGLVHDRSLFSSRTEFERQLPKLREAAERLGSVGFRSPATYRVPGWMEELPASYDSSLPLSDPYEPQPGGCCSIWPFMLGSIVELPYTLPQDHTLLTLLRQNSAAVWLSQLEAIESRHGMIESLTHPDVGYLGDQPKRSIYVEFLDAVAANELLWKPLPRELADWWRLRDAGRTRAPEQLAGTIVRSSDSPFATILPPAPPGSGASTDED
jgi:peptidoglycan/xylan/chitin deacetylase (PgdA/CDA1 family)